MRTLAMFLALGGCARGITQADGGFETGDVPGTLADAGGPKPIEDPDLRMDAGAAPHEAGALTRDAGSDGGAVAPDAGEPGCLPEPVQCDGARDVGLVLADVDGQPMVLEGSGSAFVRVLAKDGQASGNAVGGVRASLDASLANYDLYVYGAGDDACEELGLASLLPVGVTDTLAPAWGTNGPFVTIDRVLTFEVRFAEGACAAPWTLTLQGNPCPAFTLDVGPQCPEP